MGILKRISFIFLDFVQTIVVAACVFVIVYVFLLQPHQVIGSSMLPNFHHKEFILTDKVSYCLRSPKRGEVVVFQSPEDPDKDFIKRIIALPHERIKIQDGNVFINGKALSEPYLDQNIQTPAGKFLKEYEEVKLGENEYAVLGDNRLNSSDSRAWGPISATRTCGFQGKSAIIGKALLVYWPPDRTRLVKAVH